MKKYWYAAISADKSKTVVDSARTLKELGENLGLGAHVINYYYQRGLTNKKLGVNFIRIPAITEDEMLQILKRGIARINGENTQRSNRQRRCGNGKETKGLRVPEDL